ncbi:7156_t:CDS:2 [Acaulospora colombiana]|uniref:7156_t:CDS:1 n=1 Tax=Acaulospora colombiana TaxID=27376 RepID=A0ACA9PM53_9GLOM|nr:7156_t:CDS:2 [Acaulospora colombiana]
MLGLASKPAIKVVLADPAPDSQFNNGDEPTNLQPDHTEVALDTSIVSFEAIKEIAGLVPNIGVPLKATCGLLIIVLGNIKILHAFDKDTGVIRKCYNDEGQVLNKPGRVTSKWKGSRWVGIDRPPGQVPCPTPISKSRLS